jgi:hypothetical protein
MNLLNLNFFKIIKIDFKFKNKKVLKKIDKKNLKFMNKQKKQNN